MTSNDVDQTLFAALYGRFTPHAAPGVVPPADVYSLMHGYACMAGHATPSAGIEPWAATPAPDPLWLMNDAGPESGEPDGDRAAWVQVGLPRSARGHVLPAQPLLHDLARAVARLGRLDLTGVQTLLPLSFGARDTVDLLSQLQVFENLDAATTCPATVTVTTRAAEPLAAAADGVVRRLRTRHLGRFAVADVAETTPGDDPLDPPVVGDWWWGADGVGPDAPTAVRFGVTLPEWSVEAAGWITALLAGELAAEAVGTARISVSRS